MFRSKSRSLIIPQSEHSRLAGMLAQMWGNDAFDTPTIPFLSFVAGVSFHDCGYEAFDTAPIPDVEEERWVAAQLRGAERRFKDVAADIMVKLHVKRLLGFRSTPKREAAAAAIEQLIVERLKDCEFSRDELEWCDRITHFCDNLAFDFCFEALKQGSVAVFPRRNTQEPQEIGYEIKAEGLVEIKPWPFQSQGFSRFVIGYEAEGYPENREPIIVPIRVQRTGAG